MRAQLVVDPALSNVQGYVADVADQGPVLNNGALSAARVKGRYVRCSANKDDLMAPAEDQALLPQGGMTAEWLLLLRGLQVQTERLGDVHHFAWRACHRNQTVYINERDGERFGDWQPQQCAVCIVGNTRMRRACSCTA